MSDTEVPDLLEALHRSILRRSVLRRSPVDTGLARPHRLSCPWHGEDIDDLEDDDCECGD